ncbi:hypothetical protein ANN_02162 [Periplaneta americana]|uniref:Exportin-7/Ran-binding protein 17 TPR repeats domain-containing protein n=1 Tax=Periplaneta americana TaxID=6978 RepID=A0ABQ8TVH6_PERAM|nr:hypothetical protein ANN_02162 [Periplaneta americana]
MQYFKPLSDIHQLWLLFCIILKQVMIVLFIYLKGSVEHCMIGVQLLSQLTCEMNQISEADANRSLTKHRKIASSFRDTQLFEIFRLSCSLLGTARENCKSLNFNDEGQHGLMTQLLRLAHNCLTFDFIGTSTDESSDDLCTVQIPTSWRPAFLDFSTLKLFFDLYHSLPNTLSPLALSCLVQIASVRRSLFSNTERAKFLTHLVNGVKHILQNPQGLSDPSNYHEFCRLLARLKSNYQLGELVMVENYPEAIQLIAKFTVQSLQMWQFAPNSVHYLLSLWQRMVASVPYVKATEPHLLETYTPEVSNAYITSRLESVAVVVREGLEDPLDDLGMVQQQLEQLSVIGRCEYQKTCTLLVQLFDQAARAYQELMASPNAQQLDITIQEGRLTWLVYIIGSAIGGRVSFNSNDEHDAMDGELVCRVLQLMNLTDSRLAQGGCEKLELAMLSFFEQFRKIYVGDQVQKNSKVYRRLSEVLGLSDESMVLSVFIRKMLHQLLVYADDVNMLGENPQTIRENAEILLEASKAIGLEVNPEKTKYMIMSRDQNIVRNGTIQIGDLSFEEVEKFKYLGATVTNINDTREEIKHRINMGNACYYSVEKLLSSSLLSKNLKVRIYKTVILPVILYGCETWTLTLREEQRLRVFENKVLRKIFGAKRDEVTGEWRKLHNAELHALYTSPDIIRNIKSRRLRWAGHVACMGESRNAYRVITNLKYWGRSEQIISKTLQLLNDLSVGYSCVRKLVKLEEVQFMLNNHTSEHFPFLGNSVAVSEMRCRSMFYTSLGRLLMVDLGEDEDRFDSFMLPLTAAFESIGTMLASAETPVFAAEEAKKALIGLARDLRGLAFAFNTKTSYMMLFDWMYPSLHYPNYTPILLHAVDLWYHDPQVTTPVLKLFAELVQNRSQRLQFDVSSPNGILLFREASKVICSYGTHILSVEVPKDQIYPMKLKGISICFSMLKAALCGSYVNFGVFRLYGDEALDNALNTFVKLLLSIPQSDLLV